MEKEQRERSSSIAPSSASGKQATGLPTLPLTHACRHNGTNGGIEHEAEGSGVGYEAQIKRLESQMQDLKEDLHEVKSVIERRLTDLFNILTSAGPLTQHHAATPSASMDTTGSPTTGRVSGGGWRDDSSSASLPADSLSVTEGDNSPSLKRRWRSFQGDISPISHKHLSHMESMEEEEEDLLPFHESDEFLHTTVPTDGGRAAVSRHNRRACKRRRIDEDGREEMIYDDASGSQYLPPEVWTHILSFTMTKKSPFHSLNGALLTCKLWRKISLSLITSYTMPPTKPKKLARKCLAFLFANCPNLRSLRVRNCPIVNSMLYHLPERITLLDCGFTQITEEALEYLPLSLKALSIDNMAITDNGFNDLPSRLDTLSLRQVILSVVSAKKMAQRFTRLRKLTLSAQVTNVTAFLPTSVENLRLHVGAIGDKNYLWNDNVIATIVPLTNLRILEIWRCNITNCGKQTLAETHVRHLVIRQAKLTDVGMGSLPPALISLMLESTPTVTDAGLLALPQTVQSLALVKMEKISGPGLLAYVEQATNLQNLVLDEDLANALQEADIDRKLSNRALRIIIKKDNEPCPKLHQLSSVPKH